LIGIEFERLGSEFTIKEVFHVVGTE
jgi:hypothetical protein